MTTTFLATLDPMLTLFLCMAVGFVARKTKILPDNASKVMAKLETWIFCPALNFVTMAKFCTLDTIGVHGRNILFGCLAAAVSAAIAVPVARLFVPQDPDERGIYTYALAFANGGYVGDPVVLALFGDSVLSYYKLFYLPFTILIYTWGISLLVPKGERKGNLLATIMNAPTISMLLGMAMGLCGVSGYLPGFLWSTLDSLKGCMGPVAMLLAGFTVAGYPMASMLKNKKVYLATALRLAVIPAVVVGVLFLAKWTLNGIFDAEINHFVLFLACFGTAAPLGLNTVVFPEAYGGNPATGASMALVSHTLCVVTIPMMYAIMIAIFGSMPGI